MKTNSTLRQEGMNALKGKWGNSALLFGIYAIIVIAISLIPIVSGLASIFIILPLAYGLANVFLNNIRNQPDAIQVSGLFIGFKGEGADKKYLDVTCAMLLVGIYSFLWMLLLIVPGVIKSLSYSMTPFVMRDEPELSANAAIERSMAMMKGYKLKLFLMQLNFVMWFVLSLLTLGIALFWIGPYMWSTYAAFYEDVKANYDMETESH